jgi:hypothetical protein
LSIGDFRNGIFDIASKVVKQLKYIIKVLIPDSDDAAAAFFAAGGSSPTN